jgi:ATP-dependent Lhr-like helicase
MRFLAGWQHATDTTRLEGPRGVMEVVRQLAGFEVPAGLWETAILPARINGYRKAWLDELALSGEVSWGRLWGAGVGPIRGTPISLVAREDMDSWLELATPGDVWSCQGDARVLHELLTARGPIFVNEMQRQGKLLPTRIERGLSELVGLGLATCDTFGGLRRLFSGRRPTRRRMGAPPAPTGRWSLFRQGVVKEAPPAEFVARQLLRRTGVVFRRTLMRERMPVPWRDVLRVYRTLEARGEIRGGRFVAGFPGEQYALPEAVRRLRAARKAGPGTPVEVIAADPLNFIGILTPEERVASTARRTVRVA